MEVYKTIKSLKEAISKHKENQNNIGFVPTMGALHEGHLSLIKEAKKHTNIVVASVYVNPTQFNDPKDFEKYPRTLEDDLNILEKNGTDIVFAPTNEEMYPEKDTRQFNFGNLETVMEGKHRPGHFNGVAQVVSKLFDIVTPDVAVFGEKDFQQLAIIRSLVEQQNYPIKIIGAPIMREQDGLAMSSRNMRLNEKERKDAAHINAVLQESLFFTQKKSIEELEQWVVESVNIKETLSVEYFEIVNARTLQKVSSWQENCDKIGCIAVFCGNVRLIDNIKYSF
ncbi:MAG: pantoate--beta-alanine ligase [Salinivirgaceae bacterium]|nr:MAG: pantoate--beta-alanine ligase [Salinivirgaceae bacterium]